MNGCQSWLLWGLVLMLLDHSTLDQNSPLHKKHTYITYFYGKILLEALLEQWACDKYEMDRWMVKTT